MQLISRIFTTLAWRVLPGARSTPRLAPPRQRLHIRHFGPARRLTRREALRLLITGGSLTLGAGASGIGLFGIARKLAGGAARPATPLGAAIGSTAQARNTARDFVNPHTGHASLLVHLPNGSFVAYEKACTHRGVFVDYDPTTRQFVCPAHGAIFDPARKGAVVQGPATRALPQVALRINANGAITAD